LLPEEWNIPVCTPNFAKCISLNPVSLTFICQLLSRSWGRSQEVGKAAEGRVAVREGSEVGVRGE
jgi:hypothetical protein